MSEVKVDLHDFPSTEYEVDLYAWARNNARLLREGRLRSIDAQTIAEELEALAKSQRRELGSRLLRLMMHLLKWEYQPERRSKSWQVTIYTQRDSIDDLLEENPSLRTEVPALIQKNYPRAIRQAADETDLPTHIFPNTCPWIVDQLLGEYWPK